MKVVLALFSVFKLLTSVEGSEEAKNARGIRWNDTDAKSTAKKNRLLCSTAYEHQRGAPNSRCASAELMIDNELECQAANTALGYGWCCTFPHTTDTTKFQCGCHHGIIQGNDRSTHNNCAYGDSTVHINISPVCKVPVVDLHVADGGGDPHYKMYSSQLVTVQALCGLNLFASDAYGGVQVHSRHPMPLLKKEEEKGYFIISNLALHIGGDTGTVWELIADGPKLFLDRIEFDSFEDDESTTFNIFFTTTATTKTTGNGVDDHENVPKRYSIQKRVKGYRKNIIEYIFTFADYFKVVFRGNRHFKMTFVAVHGFASHSVEGFFGRTDKRGFFDRQGNNMISNKYLLRNKNYKFSIEKFAQEWQVGIDEPNLFMNKQERVSCSSSTMFFPSQRIY